MHEHLTLRAKEIYARHQLKFPVDQRSALSKYRSGELIDPSQQARREMHAYIKENYPKESGEWIVTDIFDRTTLLFDALFLAQYRVHNQFTTLEMMAAGEYKPSGPTINRWSYYDEPAAAALTEIINTLQDEYKDYLTQRNRPLNRTLNIIKHRFLGSDEPNALDVAALEKCVIDAYRLGEPMIGSVVSAYFTTVIEPDRRLFFLFDGQRMKRYEELLNLAWSLHQESLPLGHRIGRPPAVVVEGFSADGAELFGMASGEAFAMRTKAYPYGGIILIANLFKYQKEIGRMYGLLGRVMDPEIVRSVQIFLYALHEYGHLLYGEQEQSMNELATDLPSIARALNAFIENKVPLPLEDFLAVLIAEYVAQMGYTVSNQYDLGYKYSGRLIAGYLEMFKLLIYNQEDARVYLQTDKHRLRKIIDCYLFEHENIMNTQNPRYKVEVDEHIGFFNVAVALDVLYERLTHDL